MIVYLYIFNMHHLMKGVINVLTDFSASCGLCVLMMLSLLYIAPCACSDFPENLYEVFKGCNLSQPYFYKTNSELNLLQ